MKKSASVNVDLSYFRYQKPLLNLRSMIEIHTHTTFQTHSSQRLKWVDGNWISHKLSNDLSLIWVVGFHFSFSSLICPCDIAYNVHPFTNAILCAFNLWTGEPNHLTFAPDKRHILRDATVIFYKLWLPIASLPPSLIYGSNKLWLIKINPKLKTPRKWSGDRGN